MASLLDMLAKCTDDYMRILKEGGTKEEYETCKAMIDYLANEIEIRKNQHS